MHSSYLSEIESEALSASPTVIFTGQSRHSKEHLRPSSLWLSGKRLKLKALVLLYNSTYDGWSESLSTSLRACGTWPKPRLNEFEVQVWESLWRSTPLYCTFALENSGVMCVVYDVYFCNDVLYFTSCFWIYRTWNIRAFWGMIFFFLIDLWKVEENKIENFFFLRLTTVRVIFVNNKWEMCQWRFYFD